jgi:adenylosuccinate lyase
MKPRKLDVSYSENQEQVSPVGTRYTTPMARIFSDESYIQYLLDVEAENVKVLSELYPKKVPKSAATRISRIADTKRVTTRLVRDIEENKTHHEMAAIIAAMSEKAGPSGKYIHFAMTSADAVETAKAIQIKNALSMLIKSASALRDTCIRAAVRWKDIPSITRTHGQHAVPASFGLPFAFFGYSLQKSIDRLARDMADYTEGKLSGVVGTYDVHKNEGIDGPTVEKKILSRLGVKRPEMSMQTPSRENIAYIISDLAVLCGRLAAIASYIKTLKRTEILELEEIQDHGSVGSSAMPHKSLRGNPFIEERCISIARVVRGHAASSLESVHTEDFRDLTASLSDRIAIPESFILSDYSCGLVKNLLERSAPAQDNIMRNLRSTKGITSSPLVMSKLVEKGMQRQRARELTTKAAALSINGGISYYDALLKNRQITRLLSREELAGLCDPASNLGMSKELIDEIARKYRKSRPKSLLS